jgi:spermidine synthase
MTLPSPPIGAPLVTTDGDIRTLAFRPGEVQSEMRLSRPDRLMLAYVRAMMMFVLFVPRPRHILMVGLGGGSMARFCYRHFPHARITVIELRADVIALREHFLVPPDDARFRVIEADACAYIAMLAAQGGAAADPVDVLVVDGFDAAGLPPALVGSRFYAHCRSVLRDGGVLVANIFSYDPQYGAMMGRLALVFGDAIVRLAGVAGNNRIVFAVRAPLAADAAAAPGQALAVQRWLARRNGLGVNLANRLLVRLVLACLGARRHACRLRTPRISCR